MGKLGQGYCSRMTLLSIPIPNKYVGNPAYVMKGTTCICNEGNPIFQANPAYVMKEIHVYDGIQRESTNPANYDHFLLLIRH